MEILRKLRGAFGNALVWAAGWFVGGVGLGTVLHLGFDFGIPFWPFVLNAGQSLAAVGFLAGGVFSAYLTVAGGSGRLEDLSARRFGLAGGVVAGLLVPGMIAAMGAGVPLGILAALGAASGGLGAATAAGSLKLAQRALRAGGVGEAIDSVSGPLLLRPDTGRPGAASSE